MKCKTEVALIVWVLVFAIQSMGQGPASHATESWRKMTVCELISNSGKFNGVLVVVHAKVFDGMGHGILLTDDRCNKGLKMLSSQPIQEHEDYKQFEDIFYSARQTTRDHEITADFYGKFVYRPGEPRLKWALDVERISDTKITYP